MRRSLSSAFSLARILWLVVAAVLIVVGFAVDGASETGHHLGFILGGAAAGVGLIGRT
jgi:hypothetical protein